MATPSDDALGGARRERSPEAMDVLMVGLTGGVASGKSSVAAMLAARGAATCDADHLVEELYGSGRAGAAAVVELFGKDLLAVDGSVNRTSLAERVMDDRPARRRLEAAIHPLVRTAIAGWLADLAARSAPPAIAVVEAALLVETGSYRDYHRLIVVTAPLELRRHRARDAGWSSERFEQTVAAQSSDAGREMVADYLIANDRDRSALERQVHRLWGLLLEDAAALAGGRTLPHR